MFRFWFYRKMSFRDKNWSEIRISSPWGSYYCLVRHYGVVHNFLRFWKIPCFGSKPKRLLPKNFCSWWKLAKNLYFQSHEAHILSRLDLSMLYMSLLLLWDSQRWQSPEYPPPPKPILTRLPPWHSKLACLPPNQFYRGHQPKTRFHSF
jgi:hypothetical protein